MMSTCLADCSTRDRESVVTKSTNGIVCFTFLFLLILFRAAVNVRFSVVAPTIIVRL